MKSRAEILDRIRACQRLADPATNSSEHERAAALNAARLLIEKYNVTAAELGDINTEINSAENTANSLDAVVASLLKSGAKLTRGWGTSPDKPKEKKDE